MNVSSPLQDAARRPLSALKYAADAGTGVVLQAESVPLLLALLSEDRPAALNVTREQAQALASALKKSQFTAPARSMHPDHEELRRAVAEILPALLKEGREEPPVFDLVSVLHRQREWSKRTFGDGMRTEGNCKHIEKELAEIRQDPCNLIEWIDAAMLSLDGAWRTGATPEEIAHAYAEKLATNEKRTYVRTADDQPCEHDRSGEQPPTPSEVETALPPQSFTYANKDYGFVGAGKAFVLGHVPHNKDGDRAFFEGCVVRMPDGELVDYAASDVQWTVGALYAGAALYRLRVEPQPPPFAQAVGISEERFRWLETNTHMIASGAAEDVLDELVQEVGRLKKLIPAAQTLTQGGEKL